VAVAARVSGPEIERLLAGDVRLTVGGWLATATVNAVPSNNARTARDVSALVTARPT
jgi:hypothetical protein